MAERSDPMMPQRWALGLCVVVIVAVSIGVVRRPAQPPTELAGAHARWAALVTPATARAQLVELKVTEPAWEVAYDRTSDFGPAWTDVDHNGCDTRNDILTRDLTAVTYRPGSNRCVVLSGSMVDPYSGQPMRFAKADASAVQIDHLIPLHAAWILGAWRWTPARRLAFANDPHNLVAVDGPANQQKSDQLADHWRPENRKIHCVYAINSVAVHARYGLAVTRGERSALERMLERCP